jgi:DNA-binding response OmpR family regulator
MNGMMQEDIRFTEEINLDILLLSRNLLLADMYRLKLEMDGYRVSAFQSLQDWRGTRSTWRPDLVFMDITGEAGSAIADVERLRADRTLKNLPCVFLSNRSADELALRRFYLRPTDYLLRAGVSDLAHLFDLEDQRPHGFRASEI